MRPDEGVVTTTTNEHLTGEFQVITASFTWPTRPPRPPTIKYYIYLNNTITNQLTLIHSSLRYQGIYFDINIDSSR